MYNEKLVSAIQTNSCDLPDVTASDLLKHKLFYKSEDKNINSSFNDIDVRIKNKIYIFSMNIKIGWFWSDFFKFERANFWPNQVFEAKNENDVSKQVEE